MTLNRLSDEERAKLRQELRDLIIRGFSLKHALSSLEVRCLLIEIPELMLADAEKLDMHLERISEKAENIAKHLDELEKSLENKFNNVLKALNALDHGDYGEAQKLLRDALGLKR